MHATTRDAARGFGGSRRMAALLLLAGLGLLAACAPAPPYDDAAAWDAPPPDPMLGFLPTVEGYGVIEDAGYRLPPVPARYLQGVNRRAEVAYAGAEEAGTIVVDPHAKFLFLVMEEGRAMRYPIAVGREGKSLRNPTTIRRKAEWPGWTPTANMVRTEPEIYGPFREGIPGGLRSPLGARALYLYQGGRDTYYRIHGTNDLGSIGNSGSAGCIRLFNQDIIDLFDRVELGTRVLIRSYEESVRLEGEAMANRGIELPPTIVPPEDLLGPEAVAADRPPLLGAAEVPEGAWQEGAALEPAGPGGAAPGWTGPEGASPAAGSAEAGAATAGFARLASRPAGPAVAGASGLGPAGPGAPEGGPAGGRALG